MANSFVLRYLAVLAGLLCPVLAGGQPRAVAASRAACTVAWLRAHLAVREATGHNDGPAVAALIQTGGGHPGDEWCGFTQLACQRSCGLPYPAGAGGSYNWFLDPQRTYFVLGKRGAVDSIRVGHPLGIYNARRGRIAHITRAVQVLPGLRKGRPPRGFYCIAGNEGSGTSAGVHLTYYPATSIYAAANWLY